MDSSTLPLACAAAAFLAVVVWRVRPAVGIGRRPGVSRADVKECLARAEAATGPREKALALCDAADKLAARGAKGLYLRALRADPTSTEVVTRTVAGLGRRPRALDAVLWRRLAGEPWTAAAGTTAGTHEAVLATLDALRAVNDGPLRRPLRAKFFAHARDALKA